MQQLRPQWGFNCKVKMRERKREACIDIHGTAGDSIVGLWRLITCVFSCLENITFLHFCAIVIMELIFQYTITAGRNSQILIKYFFKQKLLLIQPISHYRW
jgi:hypothetical protein